MLEVVILTTEKSRVIRRNARKVPRSKKEKKIKGMWWKLMVQTIVALVGGRSDDENKSMSCPTSSSRRSPEDRPGVHGVHLDRRRHSLDLFVEINLHHMAEIWWRRSGGTKLLAAIV